MREMVLFGISKEEECDFHYIMRMNGEITFLYTNAIAAIMHYDGFLDCGTSSSKGKTKC